MEGLELQTVIVATLLVMGALAMPITAVAVHQRRRRRYERRAAVRRKEKIHL